jgi:hypothetical protein
MGWFSKLLGVTEKVSETAQDVTGALEGIEKLRADIGKYHGKMLSVEVVLILLNDCDNIQRKIEAVTK